MNCSAKPTLPTIEPEATFVSSLAMPFCAMAEGLQRWAIAERFRTLSDTRFANTCAKTKIGEIALECAYMPSQFELRRGEFNYPARQRNPSSESHSRRALL